MVLCDPQRQMAKILTYIKGFFAICGFVLGIIVIAVGASGFNPNIVGGLIIALSIISAIDAFGMSVEIKKFQKENDRLEASNIAFQTNNQRPPD